MFERGPTHSRLNEQNSRLRAKVLRCEKIIEELRREKQTMSSQVSQAAVLCCCLVIFK